MTTFLKTLFCGLLILTGVALALPAEMAAQQWPYQKTIADVTVTGTAAAVFSAADITGAGHVAATGATCAVSAAAIRATWDGTTATTSSGYLMPPGQYVISGTNTLLNLNAVRNSSTSGVLSCVVYGN